MPLPLILGIGAAAAGALGVGTGVHGVVKMKGANDTMKMSQQYHQENIDYFERENKLTTYEMDCLGKKELEILNSLNDFATLFEQIHNRPVFKEYQKNGVTIPTYDPEEIQKVSVGAGVLLGGLGGAAMGTAGGFAAAGATLAAVTALGTASTGTAIASLSGVAATNATLAVLGGGSIAAGGGGMALGSTILGATTLGAGIMIGGIIFNVVGSSLSDKADEAFRQVHKERNEINNICEYLLELNTTAKRYFVSISNVYEVYKRHFNILSYVVETLEKKDWNDFSSEEQLVTENTALLVSLLYNMGKVQLVLASTDSSQPNKVNKAAVKESMHNAKMILLEMDSQKRTENKLDWQKVKEMLWTNMPEAEYYRWIDFLEVQTLKNCVKIIAPYKAAAEYVKVTYSNTIEPVIAMQLKDKITVSYGYIETANGDSASN